MADDDLNPFDDDPEDDDTETSASEEDDDEPLPSTGTLSDYSADELTSVLNKDTIERAPPWLVSMGDVTALMLTFFVMLFSMSEIKSEKYDAVISLISTSTRPDKPVKPQPVSELNVDTTSVLSSLSTDYLLQIFKKKMAADPLLKDLPVTALPDQMVISLSSDRLFDAGSDALSAAAAPVITAMSGVLSQVGNQVEIVGHTDPIPPAENNAFATNWELSLARSISVAKALARSGYPGSMVTLGMADSRFKHLDRDIPEDRRYELARRVDIVILSEAGGQ